MSTGLTRAQIKVEVRAYLMNVDLNQAGWTDAELNAYLDEGAFYIQQLTSSLWDYAVIPVVANQADYTLPDNQYQLIRSCFDRQFLPQTTEYELDRDTSSAWRGDPTGTPCRFYLKQFNVASLYQKPRTSGVSYIISGIVSASDNFNRANENPLVSPPWTTVPPDPAIQLVSNTAVPSATGASSIFSASRYDGGIAWPADQYSEAVITAGIAFSGNLALMVRTDGAGNGYIGWVDFTNGVLSHVGIGSSCQLVLSTMANGLWGGGNPTPIFGILSNKAPVLAGDVLRIQAIGNRISLLYNGVEVLFAIDNTFTSGKPGLGIYRSNAFNAPDIAWDNWVGGEFGVSGGEAQNFTLPDNVTIDSSFSFSSEFGCVTQLINTNGSSINRFEPDPQNRFVNPDYGVVVAFADETQNLSFMYVAQPDTMFDDSQEPQFQETFHPAMVYYTLMRCFARDGEFQDMELAGAWYQAFLDWMDAALQASAKEFPTMVKSAEPYGVGNILNARLQAVGPPSQMIVIGTP